MNAEEYANLDAVEAGHWYYSGKREIVSRWIHRVASPRNDQLLLDCGAGTGRFALEMQGACRVMVLDDHEEALKLLRARFKPEQVISLAGDQVPLPDGSLDIVTALDVLEHVPDDAAVVSGFHRLLKPGGFAVITVPAGMALWSDWDEALHHFRRYNRPQLRALFPEPGWEIVHANYTNVFVYPLVWFVRKLRKFQGKRGAPGGMRSEDRIPPGPVNWLLRRLFVAPAFWPIPFPFGVSLLLVARRKS